LNRLGTTLKVVFLSVVFLVGLTYLTVEPPKKIEKKVITLDQLPDKVELIGFENQEFSAKSIIKPNTVIYVGNHESIALANNFKNMLNLPIGGYAVVSNISDAPWFIKKWQAHNQNIELKGDQKDPWIYDRNGEMRHFLQVKSQDVLKYFVYFVNEDRTVDRIYTGQVKSGTIEGSMSEKEKKENLSKAVTLVKERLNRKK
jgi:hypothetical protein